MRGRYVLLALPLTVCLAAGEPPRPVRLETVAIQPLAPCLVLSGTVQARIQADLAFRVGGKVVARPVEVGDFVRAGQLLAQVDQDDLKLSEEASEAALQAAVADASNARIELARYGQMGRNSPSFLPSEFDRRTKTSRMADARTMQAARQLSLARSQRSYSNLIADADGVVTALPVQVGQVVMAGQTIATIARTDGIEVAANVPENRLAEIKVAGGVSVTLWAAPGQVLQGRLREVGALAGLSSRTFAVKIAVRDAPVGLMQLGMTAIVTFDRPKTPIVRLPATALTDRDGKTAVWVFDPARQRADLRAVEVAGYDSDGSLLVRSGLANDEQVVTTGVGQIEPDMALTAWAGATQ